MKWDAPSVARFAADAGFARPELHTATALAMAATNGIDHYDVSAGLPGSGRWCGLWALNIDQWTDYTADELMAPARAAEVAYELTRRCQGFGWSAAWQGGADVHHLDTAATAYTMRPFQEIDRRPVGVHIAGRKLDALERDLRKRYRSG